MSLFLHYEKKGHFQEFKKSLKTSASNTVGVSFYANLNLFCCIATEELTFYNIFELLIWLISSFCCCFFFRHICHMKIVLQVLQHLFFIRTPLSCFHPGCFHVLSLVEAILFVLVISLITRLATPLMKFPYGSAIWTLDPHNSRKIRGNPENVRPRLWIL